jgi:REP-associated tyrosine transposase
MNKSNPDFKKYNRRSIRLKNYNYTQEGWYFITLIVNKRECLFCKVIDGKIILNTMGKVDNEE